MIKKLSMLIVILSLLLTSCGGNSTATQSPSTLNPEQQETAVSESNSDSQESSASTNSSSDDISSAFNTLTGTTDEPGVFASYHIELLMDTPQVNDDNTALVNETISISADVEGNNVHIFQIDPGETTAKEGYIIGDKEYKLVDGVWEESMGFIALAWAMWPLTVAVPYGTGTALYVNKTGTEDVNGRSAMVYEIDASKGNAAALAGMVEYMGEFTSVGTAWIDKETGALLKLNLDYSNNISSMDGSTDYGIGTGHIELEISNVNNVTITSPL